MKVIIPIAGVGTRLRPLTLTKHKSLLLVAGKPGLDYILDELKNLKGLHGQEVSEIIFITGYLKEQIEEHVTKNYPEFKFRFIEQKIRNGTAGAVQLAEPYIDEPFFLVYADAVYEADLSIIKKLKDSEAGFIWTQDREDWQRLGVCILDDQGYLKKIVEKPKEFLSTKLSSIGVYYVKDYKLLFEGIRYVFDNNITIKGEYYVVDAFAYMIEKKGAKFKCPKLKCWYDFGTVESMFETNKVFLKKGRHKVIPTENTIIKPPVNIADGAKIKNSTIGPYVTIAKGVEIANSVVKNSIIDERTKITDAFVRDSLIGMDTDIKGKFQMLNAGDYSVLVGGKYKKK